MKIYTKTGDYGTTSLSENQKVSKSDDRIQLLGTIDELTSNLGLVKASESSEEIKAQIERIQRNLMVIMSGVADQFNKEYKLKEEEVTHLEEEINQMEASFERKKEFVLPGNNRHSAQIDIARTVTRRAERCLIIVDRKVTVDYVAKKYMNRLADYLYIVARYTDYFYQNKQVEPLNNEKDSIITAVLDKLGLETNKKKKIDLVVAKKLIAKIEEQSTKIGLNAVIAVCGPYGNPIAVHVMDDSFLASYDIAMKKAYTSVAVKMPTKQLGELAKLGQTFFGIENADNGRIIIIGGGVPIMSDSKIIGAIGVSGGTAEQDSELAEYGLKVLHEMLNI